MREDYGGAAQTAVWSPATGGWFVRGPAPVLLALSSDIPVPGDYDGDGDVEPAVFRGGAWFALGKPTRSLGLPDDRPVILPAGTCDTYF